MLTLLPAIIPARVCGADTVKAKHPVKAHSPRASRKPLQKSRLALRFRESIPSTFEALEEVLENLLALAREIKCDVGHLQEVELALREALANAIIHGNQSDPGKMVVVSCFCQPDRGMLLVVQDEGPGFDPKCVPDPRGAECLLRTHGRGLFLMRQSVDHVRISHSGRRVTLLKRLHAR
jgi:serine/threonine-protein kinase RsbW